MPMPNGRLPNGSKRRSPGSALICGASLPADDSPFAVDLVFILHCTVHTTLETGCSIQLLILIPNLNCTLVYTHTLHTVYFYAVNADSPPRAALAKHIQFPPPQPPPSFIFHLQSPLLHSISSHLISSL